MKDELGDDSTLCRELKRQGFDLSIPAMLDHLGKIREVGMVYPATDPRRVPRFKTTVSQMSEQQQALFKALDLGRYLAA